MKSFELIGIGTLGHGDRVRFKLNGHTDWIEGEIFFSSRDRINGSLFILSNDARAAGGLPDELYDLKVRKKTGYKYSWWFYSPGSPPSTGIDILEKITFDNYELI